MKIQIHNFSGDFEIYVSIKNDKPTALSNDYFFKRDEKTLVINYSEMKSYWVYIAVYGKVFTTLTMEARFSGIISSKNKFHFFLREDKHEQREKSHIRTIKDKGT